MDLAKYKHQAPTHQWQVYVRAIIETVAWPTIVQLKKKLSSRYADLQAYLQIC